MCVCGKAQKRRSGVYREAMPCARGERLSRGAGEPPWPRPVQGPGASRLSAPGLRDSCLLARGPRAVSDTRRRQRLYFSRLAPRPRARAPP